MGTGTTGTYTLAIIDVCVSVGASLDLFLYMWYKRLAIPVAGVLLSAVKSDVQCFSTTHPLLFVHRHPNVFFFLLYSSTQTFSLKLFCSSLSTNKTSKKIERWKRTRKKNVGLLLNGDALFCSFLLFTPRSSLHVVCVYFMKTRVHKRDISIHIYITLMFMVKSRESVPFNFNKMKRIE